MGVGRNFINEGQLAVENFSCKSRALSFHCKVHKFDPWWEH